ncbi:MULTISPECIES: hypothetical protein [Halomonadaceae]|uniref:hypothetical protein n=1 Tax=Halomonadaceae TaxID=28256 RepID=UPI0015971AEB|nr:MULTISPECIES: hypothetical protein [Halomonas]QJQ96029.1 hypothetical protein HIO72_12620 [Halomonas sp. PA5]
MALQGFDKEFYLNAKLAELQADESTRDEWEGTDAATLEATLLNEFNLTPEQHYLQFGYAEGVSPNAYFNAEEYIDAKGQALLADDNFEFETLEEARNAFNDTWAGNPYEHYLQHGAAEGLNPSNAFDANAYYEEKLAELQANEDTAAEWQGRSAEEVKAEFENAGLTPLGHYVAFGQQEGLSAPPVTEQPPVEEPEDPPVEEPGERVLDIQSGDDSNINADTLADFDAIRFSGIEDERTFNLTGISDKRIYVEGDNVSLNLSEMASVELTLEDADLRLWAEEDGEAVLTSLNVDVDSDSALELGESSARGLDNVTLNGAGSLNLTGSTIGSEAQGNVVVDASDLSGNLTVDEGVLDNATSVTAGSGDDTLSVGSLALDIDGGDGDDTLVFTGTSYSYDNVADDNGDDEVGDDASTGTIAGFETVRIDNWARIDANDFEGATDFIFESRGEVANLASDQVVSITDANVDDTRGSTLNLIDADETVNIVTAFDDDGVLALTVLSDEADLDGGTLNLSGNGAVDFAFAGRSFDTVDASELEGGLNFVGSYAQETIILGGGEDTLSVFRENNSGEVSTTSTVSATDRVENFDFDNDRIVDQNGNDIDIRELELVFDEDADLDTAFAAAADETIGNEYVSFVFEDNTYLYANTDEDGGVLSGGDFAIELVGTNGTVEENGIA